MDHIWSPWRYRYLSGDTPDLGRCVFCVGDAGSRDEDLLIVHRGAHNFVILNLFPYTSGHVMIVPYAHVAALSDLSPEESAEMIHLAGRATTALKHVYRPEGFNIGMNLGHCAGAGIRDHNHMHVVPRWTGDANFVSVVSETRVLPEELHVTWRRLKDVF